MRWKLTIEYEGTAFSGWQRQPNAQSVQQALEEAFGKFCGEAVMVQGAGRTDAGVHARGQVAHVDVAKKTTAETVRDALNYYVRPVKISILSVEQVDDTFHARFSAIGRSYRYRIVNRRAPLALSADKAWHVRRPLDTDAMQVAASLLLGHHDFSTFRAKDCQSKSPMKTLDRLDVVREGEEIVIHTAARSFLYHQVRNMVGTLCLVGNGGWSLPDFKTAFETRDRAAGGPTAPACGLYFWDVAYPQK
jgi:tRNA pseudouridine38-40 synthase